MSNEKQQSLTLRGLLQTMGGEKIKHYKVPVYQRNYDWGKAQIQQLIIDIIDMSGDKNKTYYLGSLIVHERDEYFEILDGQQRFTTLSLLVIYLKYRSEFVDFSWYESPNLSFESRPKSDFAINSLFKVFCTNTSTHENGRGQFLEQLASIESKECSASILSGFKIIEDVIAGEILAKNETTLKGFTDYLIDHVEILRITVPKNTDVTHYFEVMNNRGEQLEKHEIVKAQLLSTVKDSPHEMAVFQKVWLACSDMDRYVQTKFSVTERKAIFGEECDGFLVEGFECLSKYINFIETETETEAEAGKRDDVFSLEQAIAMGKKLILKESESLVAKNKIDADDDGREERFKSVIDFPNFLMQVLCIYVKNGGDKLPPLDDKELINTFKKHIGKDAKKAKDFVLALLKIRYLFDRYIIKRERVSGKEDWSLKHYKFDGNGSGYVNNFSKEDGAVATNKSSMMLLSAFHVSYPTNSRKNWLSAVLHWLDKREDECSSAEYLLFLEDLAKAFMLNRYLTPESKDYPDFIYKIEQVSSDITVKSDAEILAGIDYAKDFLNYGQVRMFVFNYLDYLLWKDKATEIRSVDGKVDYKSGFRFSMNNSVEHFSPQTPKANEKLDLVTLHSFGNLCLLTNSDNSSLSNDGPEQKAKILNSKRDSMAPLSLKLELMMIEANAWGGSKSEATEAIKKHGDAMLKVLVSDLDIAIRGQVEQ